MLAWVAAVVLSVSAVASAGEPLALVRLFPGDGAGASVGDFQLHFGVAWYHDHRGRDGKTGVTFDPTDDLAAYLQVPVASLADKAYISVGCVVPAGYPERARPSFSLATMPGLWCEGWPKWANAEVGAYVMASPYNAWGVQVGLVNIRF
jgi:hypothetical protein